MNLNTRAGAVAETSDVELLGSSGGPAHPFSHPSAVLEANSLSGSDKRVLLAAWASDACAVEGRRCAGCRARLSPWRWTTSSSPS